MKTRLSIILIIASFLIIAATQRFDTIIAKKIVVNGSGGFALGTNAGNLDLNGKQLIIDDDADTTLAASTDDQAVLTLGAATGLFNVDTGNLKVGDGTPSFTQDGEDAYIEGRTELATFLNLQARTAISLTAGGIITPTGTYQLLTSGAAVTTSTSVPISAGETGDILILRNANAANAITIDGTGGTVECKADVVLGASDTLTLIYNGTDWNCLSSYDNS